MNLYGNYFGVNGMDAWGKWRYDGLACDDKHDEMIDYERGRVWWTICICSAQYEIHYVCDKGFFSPLHWQSYREDRVSGSMTCP
jgi:hypothetical protein